MYDIIHFFRGDFGRAYIHTFINLHGIGAYYFTAHFFGKFAAGKGPFGRHLFAPSISPKKTWEGTIISAILTCGVAVGLSFAPYFNKGLVNPSSTLGNVLVWIGFALIVIVAGTFGDLIESMFKRSYGVKDSGNIMPGHGGVLDRFDSFFLAMPFCFIYWLLLTFTVY